MCLKQYIIPILVCFLFLKPSYAQEPILDGYIPIDSLKNKEYKVFINHFNRTAPDYGKEGDSLFAHEVAMTYLWKAYQINDTLNMGKAYSMLGHLEGLRLDYLDKAIIYTENYDDNFLPATAYRLKFINFYLQGNYKKSMKMLFGALESVQKNKNDYLLHCCVQLISATHLLFRTSIGLL